MDAKAHPAPAPVPSLESIALHVLCALAEAQRDDRRMDLESLVEAVKVRRREVRATVTALHRAGLVDALRMRPTLQGFAIGVALGRSRLPALRAIKPSAIAAA